MIARRQEFTEFASVVTPRLYRSALLLSQDRQQAQDLVRVTLARLSTSWRGIRRTEGAEADAHGMLARAFLTPKVVRRNAGTLSRPQRPSDDEEPRVRLEVFAALSSLDPADRAVVVLRLWEDRSASETARLLRLSEAAVRTKGQRASAALREAFLLSAEGQNRSTAIGRPGVKSADSLVRAWLEEAVGEVDLDVATLVGAGLQDGDRLRQRRRFRRIVVAVVGLGVVAGAGLIANLAGSPTDQTGVPANHRTTSEPLPRAKSPSALAAAVIAHFPAGTKVLGVSGTVNPDSGVVEVNIALRVRTSPTVNLRVLARRPPPPYIGLGCGQSAGDDTCAVVTFHDGSTGFLYVTRELDSNGSPAITRGVNAVALGVQIDETVEGATSARELPLTAATLQAIALDPRVALEPIR